MTILRKILILKFILLVSSNYLHGQPILRVGIVNLDPTMKSYDPAFIRDSTDNGIVQTLYSNLIKIDPATGYVVSSFAKKFFWKNNNLIFILHEDYKTASGYRVGADDVIMSLKRTILRDYKVSGNLGNILCNPKGQCEGIKKINDFTVSLTFPEQLPIYLDYLMSSRFVIIPKIALDNKMNIVNYEDTTGAYYVYNSTKEEVDLRANKNHWDIYSYSPKVLKLKRAKDAFEVTSLLLNKQIDHITIASNLPIKSIETIKRQISNASIFQSDELKSVYFSMTNRGLSLPRDVRRTLAKVLNEEINDYRIKTKKKILRPTIQFLISGSYGAFGKTEIEKRKKHWLSIKDSLPENVRIEIAVPGEHWVKHFYEKKIFKKLAKNLIFIDANKLESREHYPNYVGLDKNDSSTPHLAFSACDNSAYANSTHLSWLLNSYHFNLRDKAAEQWLDTYNRAKDSKIRTSMIKDLHFDSVVMNPSIIPLYTAPYLSVAINGWKLDKFERTSSKNPLHQIYYETEKNGS